MSVRLKYLLSGLLLLVITFPKIIPEFTLAIDPQIHWVFNYLWINDFSQTQHIIFPHGPLTFLNYPLAMENNLFWGLLVQALLRFSFIVSFLYLAKSSASRTHSSGSISSSTRWILTMILLFFILEFMELDFIIIGIVANSVFLDYFKEKNYWYALAVVMMTLGFYIKISIGITALTILLSYLVFYFLEKKEIKSFIFQSISIPISLALGWLLMYQNFNGFGKYLFGIKELIGGNSDSASLYPDNNWWFLGFSFLAFIAIPILDIWKKGFRKTQSTWIVYILLGLSVFAVWKHSMAREDPWHIVKLFAWLGVFFSYVLIAPRPPKGGDESAHNLAQNPFNNFENITSKLVGKTVGKTMGKVVGTLLSPFRGAGGIILAFICLFFFYANITSTLNMFINPLDTNGYKNFTEAFFHQKDFFEKNKTKSLQNIETCKLTKTDLAIIENQTIDCYPWNYAFIAANNLNWQPRPIIQSYAAYTPWLDKQNTNHFSSKKAPQFLIWETDILNRDIWEGELTSIDKHYLLNDEPQTIVEILSNYKLISKTEDYLLFEKKENPIFKKSETKKTDNITWNKWIDVPFYGDGILRTQFQYDGNLWKWLKAKAYKDEPIFIEYQLSNGEIKKYRFTSLNAELGLWVNPFIIQPSNNLTNAITSKIRFSTPNEFLVKKEIQIKWEFSPIKNSTDKKNYTQAFNLFGKNIIHSESTLLEKKDLISNEKILSSKEYSSSHEIPFSELLVDSTSTISIAASVEAKMSYHASGLLVVVVEQDGKVILWDGKRIEDFMTIYHKWELAFSKKKIPNTVNQNAVIKVYVWNTGDEDFSIKDLSVKCIEHKKY